MKAGPLVALWTWGVGTPCLLLLWGEEKKEDGHVRVRRTCGALHVRESEAGG